MCCLCVSIKNLSGGLVSFLCFVCVCMFCVCLYVFCLCMWACVRVIVFLVVEMFINVHYLKTY